jgi:hypothetical protein
MEITKLYDALDGLCAYDTGATDSGIKDDNLRSEVKGYLKGLDKDQFRMVISSFIRESFLTETRLQQGYGIKDVVAFIEWLDESMNINL